MPIDKNAISGKAYQGGEGVLVFKNAEVCMTRLFTFIIFAFLVSQQLEINQLFIYR